MIQLRPYQRASIDAVWQFLANRDGNPAVVIPTGGGKSPTMAGLIREALQNWPGTRIAVVAHVRELVQQNAQKMLSVWPEAPIGIYSASLGRRDTAAPVVFASIQSIFKRAGQLGRFDLVLVDEAHRIPVKGEGMYRQFLADAARFNPDLRVVGFTATPYRLGVGPVCAPENLLTDICYEVHLRELIEAGYLSRLISKASLSNSIDTSGMHIRGGEFVAAEIDAAANRAEVVAGACREMVSLLADRRAWIVFCASVAHAQAVDAELQRLGIESAVVEGSLSTYERDARIGAFQAGRLRALCNVNVLTEGFDATHVDAVVMLRPTKSPGLYVQMVGRGLRLHKGKENCLVLDFAGNILEHGPVDAIRVRRRRKGSDVVSEVETQPTKLCPACGVPAPIQAASCGSCGHRWPLADRVPHDERASAAPIMSDEASAVDTVEHEVTHVTYAEHAKPGTPPSLRVTYRCGLQSYREWVCVEHGGYARQRAVDWWRRRAALVPGRIDLQSLPRTVTDALAIVQQLPTPTRIVVRRGGKYPEIVKHVFSTTETADTGAQGVGGAAPADAPRGGAVPIAGGAGAASADAVRGVPALPQAVAAVPQLGQQSAGGVRWPWMREVSGSPGGAAR